MNASTDHPGLLGRMALGTCLSNLLGLKDLDQQLVGVSKILIAGVKMKKSQFTRFMGSEE